LNAFAQQRAGCAVNLLALPYDQNRQRLLDDLAGSSAAMMLSWHEGFGLTGWEAIGAEVPLILGTNSGLYELIGSKLGGMGLGCVRPIDIEGRVGSSTSGSDPDDEPLNFTEQDALRVRDALLEIAANSDHARTDAKRLRQQLLEEGCTWEHAALSFAQDLGLDASPPPAAAPIPVPTEPERPRPAVGDPYP
jgi:hypothetical protein